VNLVDRIRNVRYPFLLTESLSRAPKGGREDEEPRLFETLVSQPVARPGREGDFPYLHRPQPFEKPRFRKISASKR
jgi:hypothetical protein